MSKFESIRCSKSTLFAAGVLAALAPASWAEGTETLGASTQPEATGSDVLIAGVGLVHAQPATLSISIPEDAAIVQVIAYWEGIALTEGEQGATDTVEVNGNVITGQRIGGPTHIIGQNWTSTYRADVTNLDLVGTGDNFLSVGGLDFQKLNDGFGLMVTVDDGERATDIQVRDGNDYAFIDFEAPLDALEMQTFTFDAENGERDAEIGLMFGHVSSFRANVVEIYVDGELFDTLIDALGDLDGAEWDSFTYELTLPAGATSVSVLPRSFDLGIGPKAGNGVASLTWVLATFELDPAEEAGGPQGCSPWLWSLCPQLWDGADGDDATETLTYFESFNAIMGVTRYQSRMYDDSNLLDAIWGRTCGSFWWRFMNRQAATALANSDATSFEYPLSTDWVVAIYRDAIGADEGNISFFWGLVIFYYFNWQSCPLE